jgi:hypothetical protein
MDFLKTTLIRITLLCIYVVMLFVVPVGIFVTALSTAVMYMLFQAQYKLLALLE